MRDKAAISGWDRFVFWVVITVLIAGWWGVLGALFHWKTDAWLLWLAMLNIVLTVRWFATRMEKRSPKFRYTFAAVARITATWFPAALASLITMVFVGCLVESMAQQHLSYKVNDPKFWVVHAATVTAGTSIVALLALFLKRHRLLPGAENPDTPATT